MKLNIIISTFFVNYALSAVSAQSSCDCTGLSMIGSGNSCRITNRKWNETLYPFQGPNEKDQRKIFTWITSGCDDQCDWKIETLYTNSGLKFKLKSLYSDEYIYAAGDYLKFDNDRRNVFSNSAKCTCNKFHWDIQALNDNSGYVTIKSTKYDEYLYGAVDDFNYDSERRRVFTWKYTSKDVAVAYDTVAHWRINCS